MVMTKRRYQSHEMLRKVLVYSWMKMDRDTDRSQQIRLVKRWHKQEQRKEKGSAWKSVKNVNSPSAQCWTAIGWGDL